MASLTLRGTPTHLYALNGTTNTCAKPTGVVQYDIMFAVLVTATGYTTSTPSGWTSLGQANSGSYYELFYKIAGGSEPSDYTWGCANAKNLSVIVAYQKEQFNHINAIDQTSNTTYTTSNTTNRAASMTVTAANSPLVFFGIVQDDSVIRTQTKPSVPTTDWVEEFDDGDTSAGGFVEICSMIWTGSGATGNIDSTISASKTTKHAFAVSLNPPTGVTVSPSVLTATFSVQAPVIAGAAAVSTSAITATFTINAPTVTNPTPSVSNLDKHTASFTNLSKS